MPPSQECEDARFSGTASPLARTRYISEINTHQGQAPYFYLCFVIWWLEQPQSDGMDTFSKVWSPPFYTEGN